MVRRALGLLLTDLRRWHKDLHAVQFGIGQIERGGGGVLLPDLLLLFNVWNSGQFLVSSLLNNIDLPKAWSREPEVTSGESLKGQIDWSKTLELRQKGNEGYVVQSVVRRKAEQEGKFISAVLAEFREHCMVLSQHIVEEINVVIPPYVSNMLQDIQSVVSAIDSTLKQKFDVFSEEYEEVAARAGVALKDLLGRTGSLENLLLIYQSLFEMKTPRFMLISSGIRELARWRERYLACDVGLAEGDVFGYVRSGSAADLYEMWCFFEIAAAVKRVGAEDVMQLCFIRRGQVDPQFRLGTTVYAYFDYKSAGIETAGVDILGVGAGFRGTIPGVFVEWFIRNNEEYRKSVCMDVKYANWETREILKVAGYMQNYGVDNGLIVIRDQVRRSTIGGKEIAKGLYRVEFPAGAALWLMNLLPLADFEEQNLMLAEQFVKSIFQGKEE
jgi:hypothetical protein